MTKQPKVIKQADKPMHPDLRRLAKSMQTVLERRYPDRAQREVVARQIMTEIKVA